MLMLEKWWRNSRITVYRCIIYSGFPECSDNNNSVPKSSTCALCHPSLGWKFHAQQRISWSYVWCCPHLHDRFFPTMNGGRWRTIMARWRRLFMVQKDRPTRGLNHHLRLSKGGSNPHLLHNNVVPFEFLRTSQWYKSSSSSSYINCYVPTIVAGDHSCPKEPTSAEFSVPAALQGVADFEAAASRDSRGRRRGMQRRSSRMPIWRQNMRLSMVQ